MLDKHIEVLENKLFDDNGLLIKLRLGKGLDESKVKEICDSLSELIDELKNVDYIPKRLALIFVDLYSAVESTCSLYNEEEINKIMDFADIIMNLVRECLI